jgi:hypothetical protein
VSPNCLACDEGNHEQCIVQWCECRQKGRHTHRTLPITEQTVSNDTLLRDGQCEAALNLVGEHFPCDLDEHHDGLAHSSQAALAIWSPVPGGMATDRTIPLYGMLDLWMALGGEPEEFDPEYAERGYADMWAWLLGQVRTLNARGFEERVQIVKESATINESAVINAEPFLVRARERLEEFSRVDRVVMDLEIDEDICDGTGRTVHYTGRGTLTIEGRLH